MSEVAPDIDVIEEWLDLLYGEFDEGEYLTLFAIDHQAGDSRPRVDWLPMDNYSAVAERAVELAETCDVWVGTASRTAEAASRPQRERGRGRAADCAHLPGLWLDIDIEGPGHKGSYRLPPDVAVARALIARFPIEPTVVVHSGGGLQAWWLFPEPLPAAEAGELLDRWAATWAQYGRETGWHVDNVFDVARVMRLPGTVNRKIQGDPRPVVAIESCRLRPNPSDIDVYLVDPPAPEPAQPAASAPAPPPTPAGPDLPGSVFNDTHTGADVLQALGWQHCRTDPNGDQHWTRPGKDPRQGSSATVYAEDGHTTIYSDTVAQQYPTIEVRRPYDPFGLLTHFRYRGDWRAASDDLARQGYGTKRTRMDLHALIGSAPSASTASGGPGNPEGRVVDALLGAPTLPDEFWTAHPRLEHIRRAAHARQRSASAVLHVVLARVAAFSPHTLTLPAIVGAPSPLSYFTAVVAPPGVGKSSASAIASDILPAPYDYLDHVPLGSGEGLIEMLFDLVKEPDPENPEKQRVTKKQTRHNAFLYTDEGQVLGEIGGRKGATLLPTIRSMWTGGALGQANASEERKRVVPALSYVFGLTIALQPTRADALLDDADAGTPQRFGWASGLDPTIPDDRVDWPGELDWRPPPRLSVSTGADSIVCGGSEVILDDEIVDEVRRSDRARARGEVLVDALDAHADLYRLKVATLLALLMRESGDGAEVEVTADHWRLAGMVKGVSDAVRDGVIEAVKAEAARREEAAVQRHVRREARANAVIEERRRVGDAVERIVAKLTDKGPMGRSDLRRALRSYRDVFDAALAQAEADRLVTVEAEPSHTGSPKQTVRLAPVDDEAA